MTSEPATYPGYRFPAEIICYTVWLYYLFSLSFRDIKLILAERGITVSHGSLRQWCPTFGGEFARKLRRHRPQPGDIWYSDEVFRKIKGELCYLWRAVDQHGVVLDILLQDRRSSTAAKRFFKRLLAGLKYKPRRLVTDGLRSYGVAYREILTRGETPKQSLSEQPHRKFAPADAPPGAADAEVQIARAGSALPVIPRHDLWPLSSEAPPADR